MHDLSTTAIFILKTKITSNSNDLFSHFWNDCWNESLCNDVLLFDSTEIRKYVNSSTTVWKKVDMASY